MTHGIPRAFLRALRAPLALAVVALAVPAANARPDAPALAQRAVDRWSDGAGLRGLDVGVAVQCTDDGAVWASHDADRPFATASAAKLLTAAAALEHLGLDARWRTSIHGRLVGRVVADLRIVGRGDPQLLEDDIEALADALVARGLERVDGDLIVDAGWFDAALEPPGFDIKDSDASYAPYVSAAGSMYGAFAVDVRPGAAPGDPVRVSVDPPSDGVVVHIAAKTVSGEGHALVIATRDGDGGVTDVVVSGTLGARVERVVERKRVGDPGLFTGYLLARALDKRGVSLAGTVRVVYDGGPGALPELAGVDSAPLAALLRDMNTWSNNSVAEKLFKQLGRADAAPATWARAQSAARAALEGLGVRPADLVLVNGSGLYIATHIAPRSLSALLVHYARGDDAKARAFRDSLAVAGADGTLRWRLRSKVTRGKVRAKTGTLDEVAALAGYVPTSGCELAFVVLVNGATPERGSDLRKEIDRLILALAKL